MNRKQTIPLLAALFLALLPPEINVPNLFTPKAINDALDREKKKNGRR